MREIVKPKRELAPLLISRIKVMAKLDIARGGCLKMEESLKIGGREVDVRVSTLPSINERVVMRLLDKQAGRLNLGNLGMDSFFRSSKVLFIDPRHIPGYRSNWVRKNDHIVCVAFRVKHKDNQHIDCGRSH